MDLIPELDSTGAGSNSFVFESVSILRDRYHFSKLGVVLCILSQDNAVIDKSLNLNQIEKDVENAKDMTT